MASGDEDEASADAFSPGLVEHDAWDGDVLEDIGATAASSYAITASNHVYAWGRGLPDD